jgi:hypothetical protein
MAWETDFGNNFYVVLVGITKDFFKILSAEVPRTMVARVIRQGAGSVRGWKAIRGRALVSSFSSDLREFW